MAGPSRGRLIPSPKLLAFFLVDFPKGRNHAGSFGIGGGFCGGMERIIERKPLTPVNTRWQGQRGVTGVTENAKTPFFSGFSRLFAL